MRQLVRDITHVHRARREWLRSNPNKEFRRRSRRMNMILFGGTVLGLFALLTADEVVELVLGIGILIGPAIVLGFYVWMYLKMLRTVRAEHPKSQELN